MASGLFLDPHKLLVLAPLVTSTATFWFAVDQAVMLGVFQDSVHTEKSNAILPTYFKRFLPKALIILPLLNGISAATAIANILMHKKSVANPFYWSGMIFSLAHFAFVPAVAWKVKDIMEDNTKGRSTTVLTKWMNVHYVRMWTVDFFAFGSFLAATLGTVKL